MAGDDNSIHSQELDPPPPEKPKINTDTEKYTEAEKAPPGSSFYKGRLIRKGQRNDLECSRQRELFYKQFIDSEGFDVDWDSFDYVFSVINFDWEPYIDDEQSNVELLDLLIQAAIEDHDKNNGTKLKFDKNVSAHILPCKGFMFYITFSAKDILSSNQVPKLYQAKVWNFCDEISVQMVRLRPTQLPS